MGSASAEGAAGQPPTEHFEVIVVGGGHAGCEAALTAARLGCSTALFTLNLDRIAWQPCNPAVGGPAKSQLVHEVDALGGVIGRLADATALQKRVLNASRGPAVLALRAQTDKRTIRSPDAAVAAAHAQFGPARSDGHRLGGGRRPR